MDKRPIVLTLACLQAACTVQPQPVPVPTAGFGPYTLGRIWYYRWSGRSSDIAFSGELKVEIIDGDGESVKARGSGQSRNGFVNEEVVITPGEKGDLALIGALLNSYVDPEATFGHNEEGIFNGSSYRYESGDRDSLHDGVTEWSLGLYVPIVPTPTPTPV